MGIWDLYERRISVTGETKRTDHLDRAKRTIRNKIVNSLSYYNVDIDGTKQDVAIIDSDNFNEKLIYSMPGESLRHGGIVTWVNNYWLITERDPNGTLYERCRMLQCNYLLKWVSSDGVIHQQWCVVEDGTKYLTGEYEDRNLLVTRGDTRLAITVPVNEDTATMTRETRFLIDHPDSKVMLAYLLSKPLKVGTRIDNTSGVFKYVLQEVTTTDSDNQDFGIADYYKYYPDGKDRGIDFDKHNGSSSSGADTTNERKIYI